jgi:hypothetical protein
MLPQPYVLLLQLDTLVHKEKTAQQMPCGFIWFEII